MAARRTKRSRDGVAVPVKKPNTAMMGVTAACGTLPVASASARSAAETRSTATTRSCASNRAARNPPAAMPIAPPRRKTVSAEAAAVSGSP